MCPCTSNPSPTETPRPPSSCAVLSRRWQGPQTHLGQPLQVAHSTRRGPAHPPQRRHRRRRPHHRLRHHPLSPPRPRRRRARDAAQAAPRPPHRPCPLARARARHRAHRRPYPRPGLEARHRPRARRRYRARFAGRGARHRARRRRRALRRDGLAARAPERHRATPGQAPPQRRRLGALRPEIHLARRAVLPAGQARHSRDGKRGKPQIVFGLLCNREGCPIAVEVFEGNTADPRTVGAQRDKLRRRFGLSRVVLVGDRGMLTEARIREEVAPAGLDWITTLRAPAIRELVSSGAVQRSMLDDTDLAEIRCDAYPGERLIVCRNERLAEQRAHKREALLQATEALLAPIVAATQRDKRRLVRRRLPFGSARSSASTRWPSTSSSTSPRHR